jgi:hypothetical protein
VLARADKVIKMAEIRGQMSEVRKHKSGTIYQLQGIGRFLCALCSSVLKSISDLRPLISGLCALLLALSVFYPLPQSLLALGPWKAQVVDAEIRQPLQGVVVIAVWKKYLPSPGTLGVFAYADSIEEVTGGDGQFVIAERNLSAADSLILDEPDFYLFKPGYGQWRFQGEEGWLNLDAAEKKKRYEEAGRQFESKGVIIEIPPLKTREERLKFYQSPGRRQPNIAPPHRMKRWTDAQQTERKYLGL